MGWDVILFDLDGTLTDSGPGITHAAQYALDAFGVHVEDARTLSFFVGPPLVETFARYFPPEQIPAAIEQFRKYYREHGWLENEPYPGVGDCLQALAVQGKKMFVATSKLEEMARRVLTHFGLMQYFTDVCGGLANNPESGKKISVVRRALASAAEQAQSARKTSTSSPSVHFFISSPPFPRLRASILYYKRIFFSSSGVSASRSAPADVSSSRLP